MAVVVPTQTLIGGYKIPVVGFGTAAGLTPAESQQFEAALEAALESGYRHIDTAYYYENEEMIGKVLKKWTGSGKLKREELFITTKLPAFANSPEKVESHLKESLKRLQLDYVDLYLIHFPIWMESKNPGEKFGEQILYSTDHVALWKKLEEQVDVGRTKTIGLSNFNKEQVSKILKFARIKPASLQIETHIYLQNKELVKYAQDNGIVVVGYSSLGTSGIGTYSPESGLAPRVLDDPTVTKLATKYQKSPAQIVLKFLLQKNIVVIPKSYTPERIKQNIDLFDFTLNVADFKALEDLDVGERARIIGPVFIHLLGEKGTSHPEWPFQLERSYYLQPAFTK